MEEPIPLELVEDSSRARLTWEPGTRHRLFARHEISYKDDRGSDVEDKSCGAAERCCRKRPSPFVTKLRDVVNSK